MLGESAILSTATSLRVAVLIAFSEVWDFYCILVLRTAGASGSRTDNTQRYIRQPSKHRPAERLSFLVETNQVSMETNDFTRKVSEAEGCPYIVDVVDYDYWNNGVGDPQRQESQVVSIESKLFRHWEDAVDFFFSCRIQRDFCFGDNFKETEELITRWEMDEGGETYYTLHKWPGFEECRKVAYVVENEDTKERLAALSSYNGLIEYLKSNYGEGAYVYWWDDTAGAWGYVKSDIGDTKIRVENHTGWKETEYSKSRKSRDDRKFEEYAAKVDEVLKEEEDKDELPF